MLYCLYTFKPTVAWSILRWNSVNNLNKFLLTIIVFGSLLGDDSIISQGIFFIKQLLSLTQLKFIMRYLENIHIFTIVH